MRGSAVTDNAAPSSPDGGILVCERRVRSTWSGCPGAAFKSMPCMNPKPRPNHARYLEVLRAMTPEQRLLKAFELSDLSRQLFEDGLRRRFPDLPEAEFRELLLGRLEKCHNRNY